RRKREIARDRENRGLAESRRDVARGVECGIGLDGQKSEVDPCDRLVVCRADDARPELLGSRAGTLFVPRADDDIVLAGCDWARSEGPAEAAGPPEDRHLHAGDAAASRTASASLRRASSSIISVRVTTGRTPSGSSVGASCSSNTSASINPS